MEVTPAETEPGETMALTYPPGHRDVRGVAFSFSGWTADGWEVTHCRTAGSHSGRASWWSVEDAVGRGGTTLVSAARALTTSSFPTPRQGARISRAKRTQSRKVHPGHGPDGLTHLAISRGFDARSSADRAPPRA